MPDSGRLDSARLDLGRVAREVDHARGRRICIARASRCAQLHRRAHTHTDAVCHLSTRALKGDTGELKVDICDACMRAVRVRNFERPLLHARERVRRLQTQRRAQQQTHALALCASGRPKARRAASQDRRLPQCERASKAHALRATQWTIARWMRPWRLWRGLSGAAHNGTGRHVTGCRPLRERRTANT